MVIIFDQTLRGHVMSTCQYLVKIGCTRPDKIATAVARGLINQACTTQARHHSPKQDHAMRHACRAAHKPSERHSRSTECQLQQLKELLIVNVDTDPALYADAIGHAKPKRTVTALDIDRSRMGDCYLST